MCPKCYLYSEIHVAIHDVQDKSTYFSAIHYSELFVMTKQPRIPCLGQIHFISLNSTGFYFP